VSDVRCPACGASVPATAEWCSLCYAVLRQPAAAPEAVREPVRAPVAVSATPQPELAPAALDVHSQTATPDIDSLPSVALSAAQLAPGAGKHAAPPAAGEKKWPCPRCGEQVPISLDLCNSCGAGFLVGATARVTTRLPVVGDVGRLSSAQRMMMTAAIAFVFMLILIVVATVGGHII
jgi:hypothetical protein